MATFIGYSLQNRQKEDGILVSSRPSLRMEPGPWSKMLVNIPNRWTISTMDQWAKKNFELEPEEGDVWTLQPPSDEDVSFRNWFKYYKAIEDWKNLKKEEWTQDFGLFYKHLPVIIKASFCMVEAAKELLALNCKEFLRLKLDRRVWQNGIYDVAEIIRCKKQGNHFEEFLRQRFLPWFMKEMSDHFRDFLKLTEYEFNINVRKLMKNRCYLSPEHFSPPMEMIYKFLINIGNMHRYCYWEEPNASQAFLNYDIARRLQNQNGRSYYQTGVLHSLMGEMLGAMYHFERALLAGVPIENAKSDLLEIHHKVNKKHHAAKKTYWYFLSKYLEKDVKGDRGFQREFWVLPGNQYKHHLKKIRPAFVPPPNKKQHLDALSTEEIVNRFKVTLTLAYGMIVSKIGMDEFEEVAEECLVYFEGLLQRPEFEKGTNFVLLIETVGLSLGTFELAKQAKLASTSTDQDKYNLKMTTLFTLQLFSVTVERLSKLISLLDWDNEQMQYLSAAVTVWCLWLRNNVKCWNIPHIRPRFSIRYIEKSRNLSRSDTTDDVWAEFAKLLTLIDKSFKGGVKYVFPNITTDATVPNTKAVAPFKEYAILSGFFPWIDCNMYNTLFHINTIKRESRAQLLLRFASIHLFGNEIIVDGLSLLKRDFVHNRFEYTCNTKLLVPKDAKDACGLYERNYWFWVNNFERIKQEEEESLKSTKERRPDCNGARVILRKKKSQLVASSTSFRQQHELPITDTNKLWCIMDDHQFRSDMVVTVQRIVIDTNCFIDKLPYVEKLISLSPRPILLPITVVLELKGLSKGGLKVRDREHFKDLNSPEAQEKLKQSNEVARNAKEALDLIESNVKYFRTVTTRGQTSEIRSIFERIGDPHFDPSVRNDNRILETCVYLEFNDKADRQRDTPMRLYRKTVLLTNDKGMRVKCTTHEIPSKEIECMVSWLSKWSRLKKPELKDVGTQPEESMMWTVLKHQNLF